jgi:hypothetical protein
LEVDFAKASGEITIDYGETGDTAEGWDN